MKTTSVKLQRIAAIVAIVTASTMPAFAVTGPVVSTWIPGAEITETVGSVSTTRQPGPYNSRDVYKVFVNAVAGKDLRLVVTGATGVKVDYFDQQRDNGLYAIFGAVDEGAMTLSFQTAPTGTTTWTTVGTKVLTAGPRRTLIYDTADVPINVWWDCKGLAPGGASPTAAQIETTLDTDFANLKADGFTCVNLVWRAAWNNSKSTIYSNLTQHGMKIQQYLYTANDYVRANLETMSLLTHNNVALLELETALNTDMLADVGSGVKLKDHPQLWTYNQVDESQARRGDELQAMLIKNLDPLHSGAGSHQGQISSYLSAAFTQSAFSDFIVTQEYPLATDVGIGNFTFGNRIQANLPRLNTPDNMDWARKKDLRREMEVIVQAFGFGGFRLPNPKELRAMVLMAASRGSRPLTYFIYGYGSDLTNVLLGPPYATRTANLNEAKLVNQKLQGWMPIYKNLFRDENGTKIPYTPVAASSGNLFFSGFEGSETTFGAVNTAGAGANGSARFGQMPADELLKSTTINVPLDVVPLNNSCVYSVWVNDNGNADMTYKLTAEFQRNDGTYYNKPGGFVNLPNTAGWQQLTLDLTAEAGDGNHSTINRLFLQANTPSTPVAYSIDDVKVTYAKPAYTPTYGLNGGVVGTFLHAGTGKRYIMVVNTDVVNTKTVAVNVVGNSGAATKAKDVDTGTVYNLTPGAGYGVLNVSLAAGDGALLEVDPAAGMTALYSNDMESGSTYGGALVTTPAPHLGQKSEQRPASATGHSANINVTLPAGTVSSAFHRLWVFDNNNGTQTYRLGVTFIKPDLTAITDTAGYVAAGSAWTQLNYDITSLVNLRKSQGYTKIKSILLWANNTAAYVPFYLDDVVVEYQ